MNHIFCANNVAKNIPLLYSCCKFTDHKLFLDIAKAAIACGFYISMVAGAGFGPATFGL